MGNRIHKEQSHLPLILEAGSGKRPWQSRLSTVLSHQHGPEGEMHEKSESALMQHKVSSLVSDD